MASGPEGDCTAAFLATGWETVMDGVIPWRRSWEELVLDLVEDMAGPLRSSLDVGCGPGGSLRRLATRRPGARLVGLDRDPSVVALATEHVGDVALVLAADVSLPGWAGRALRAGARGTRDADDDHHVGGTGFDLVRAEAVMHMVGADRYPTVAAGVHELLRPGGVYVDLDEMPCGTEARVLGPAVAARRAAVVRADVAAGGEDFRAWRRALLDAYPAVGAPASPPAVRVPTAQERIRSLLDAGFSEAATVASRLDTALVVAVR